MCSAYVQTVANTIRIMPMVYDMHFLPDVNADQTFRLDVKINKIQPLAKTYTGMVKSSYEFGNKKLC